MKDAAVPSFGKQGTLAPVRRSGDGRPRRPRAQVKANSGVSSCEVRAADECSTNIQDVNVTKDMLDLARHIVDQNTGHLQSDKFEGRKC
jgi:hypothetical protein